MPAGPSRGTGTARPAGHGAGGAPGAADAQAGPAAVDARLTRARVHGRRPGRSPARGGERPPPRHGGRATTVRRAWAGQGTVSLAPHAGAAAGRPWGWRVSVTTPPPGARSRPAAGLASRRAALVARALVRRHGHPRSLTPRDLARDDQATGVIRLWSRGLRVLTRLALGVRPRWATAKTVRAGRSSGHPTRATAHPPAARLLEAVQDLTLPRIRAGRRQRAQLTPLARGPRRMLARLDCPDDSSTRRCPDAHQPPSP
jgi:hypothetical protein